MGVQAAETLREVFANNAEVLDLVTDEMIAMFVQLIRLHGRQLICGYRCAALKKARSPP